MQQILIDSIPLEKRQHLDSVTKINNAIRKHIPVYCTLESNVTHQLLRARHRGLTFQVQFASDGKWYDASIKNIWKEKGVTGETHELASSQGRRSHRDALEQAMTLLRARTYHANLSVGSTWKVALRRAQRWSLVGRAGFLFSSEEELQHCFDEHGVLIGSLPCVWQGDFAVIAACLHEHGFAATEIERLDQCWSRLTVSLLSKESQTTHEHSLERVPTGEVSK